MSDENALSAHQRTLDERREAPFDASSFADLSADAVVQRLKEAGFRRAKIGGVDIDGVLRGKYVSLDKLRSALAKGYGFCDVIFGWDMADELYDDATLTGWHTGYPDARACLDPRTARRIPWERDTVAVLSSFQAADGRPHPACPRSALALVEQRARRLGLEPLVGVELEFFVFRSQRDAIAGGDRPRPLDPGMMGYSWLRLGQESDFFRRLFDLAASFRTPLEGLHPETGPGVYEAAIAAASPLEAADRAVLFKSLVKELAHRHGFTATFMAKPQQDLPGCSGHLHQSLQRDGRPAFEGTGGTLTPTLRQYVAGQLRHMADLTAFVSPTINSYKRTVPGLWAPMNVSWGLENRTCSLRVIEPDGPGARVEHRQPAADMNPYLAIAATLAAGLDGVESGLTGSDATTGDATARSDLPPLPRSLHAAVERLDASAEARALLGEELVQHYLVTRRWELRQFERAVTDWERSRYLELA